MAVTHNVTLDVDKNRMRLDQSVHVRTGDKSSQTVKCALTKDGAAYSPASGTTAKLEILKPDNTWTVTSATVSGSNVSGVVPLEAMSAPGECKRAYFRLISGSTEDTTEDFHLHVFPNAYDQAIESRPYSDQLDELIEAASEELQDTIDEVRDMRIAVDGGAYASAGDAVRAHENVIDAFLVNDATIVKGGAPATESAEWKQIESPCAVSAGDYVLIIFDNMAQYGTINLMKGNKGSMAIADTVKTLRQSWFPADSKLEFSITSAEAEQIKFLDWRGNSMLAQSANFAIYKKGSRFAKWDDAETRSVKNAEDIESINEGIDAKIGNVNKSTETMSFTTSAGSINGEVGNTISFGTQTYWLHTGIDVAAGETYEVTLLRSANANITHHLSFTNDSGLILANYIGGAATSSLITQTVTVPIGATKMYVASAGDNANNLKIIKILGYIDLQSQINEIGIVPVVPKTYEITSRMGYVTSAAEENTLEGIKHARKSGYNHIRMSVSFTLDGVGILSHDETISINGIAYTIAETNYSVLSDSVETYEDAVLLCKRLGMMLDVELKYGVTNAAIQSAWQYAASIGMCQYLTWTYHVVSTLAYITSLQADAKLGLIAHMSTSAVDSAVSLKNNSNYVRLDCFNNLNNPSWDDDYSDANLQYAAEKGIPIKIGSAYNETQLLYWLDKAQIVEVAGVEYPYGYVYKRYVD